MSDRSAEGEGDHSLENNTTDEIVPAGAKGVASAESRSADGSDPITVPVEPASQEDSQADTQDGLADTDVLGGTRDDDDTDVLEAVDEASTDEREIELRVTAEQAPQAEPSGAAFGQLDLKVADDTTDPSRPTPEVDSQPAASNWAAIGELQRAFDAPSVDEVGTDDRTLEFDAVYTRALLRRTSEQLGGEEPSAELVDPFEMTGFRILEVGEEPSEPHLARSPSTGRFEQAPSTGRSDRPEQPRDWSRPLAVGLDTADPPVPLGTPWAQLVEELRQETLAESDVRLRSSYLVLLASVLRLHGDVGEIAAARLEEAGARAKRPVRTLLLNLLVKHWDQPSERFVELLERLEAWDEDEQPNTAAVRRASIVVERLLAGGLDARTEEQLERKLTSPETLPGLTLRAVRAHRGEHRSRAAHIWRQVSRHLRDDPREVLVDAAAYFLRGTPGFFDYLEKRLQTTQSSRILWLMMQREAAAVGDHLREAVALRYLVASDVALGRRLGDESAARRKRLKQITAARFFRLATLLRGLGQAQRSDDALGKLEPHGVMRDAVSLSPRHPLYLRRLARWSRSRGDLNNCARSLGSLAMSYEDVRLAALACTELARTIFIGGGRSEMIDQYLDEALAHDGACKSARFARAVRLLADGDETGYEAFVAGSSGDVSLVDFPDAERALAVAEDFSEWARVLEHKLEHAVEPHDWATLTFRLAQLHAWYLSPTPDARLRVEFLEQVLIADDEHLDAWVEILDLRLARREYAEAAKALERLAGLSDVQAERAGWLTELAGLCEHFLGTPGQAYDHFERATELAPDNVVAFFGALRTDVASSADAVETIVERLDAGVGVRESQEMALELVLRVDEAPAAWEVLDERFPDQPFWMFVRICTGIERGLDDPETVERLWDMWTHPSVEPLLAVFERLFEADRPPPRAKLVRRLNQIKGSPVAEGRLVRAMHDVRHLADAELEGVLAAMRARRCTDAISRATDLMVMAVSFLWRGEYEQALRVCEHLLERHPDYLPALKLAKIGNDKLQRWAALARVCEREAERTGVAQIAFEDRLVASEVQRNHLGDFDAACQQYHAVLLVNPGHREAFDKLKPLLLQRGEVDQLIELYERRLSHANATGERSVAEQCELLNEMADIALHRGKDIEAAIDYFRRSLDLEPNQLRSLRILAELYQESDRLDAALDCYRRAAELTDNEMLVERLWVQMAELLEQAGRASEALEAYEVALRSNPSRTDIILDVARLEAEGGDLETALIHLQRLESTASNPEVLHEGRAKKARYMARLGRPAQQVVAAYRELLLHHPEDLEAVDELCAFLDEHDQSLNSERFFGKLAYQSLREMQGRPFEPHFDIARKLGHADRAFRLAAVSRRLGYGDPQMDEFYERAASRRRWPTAAVPATYFDKMLPGPLLEMFLSVLRASEPAVRRGADPAGASRLLAQARPLDPASTPAIELGARWPTLFGIASAEVLEVEHVDKGSRVLAGAPNPGGASHGAQIRVLLDARWRNVHDPTGLLVHLGSQLAAHVLGVGGWFSLDRVSRFVIFSRLIGQLVSGWGGAAASRPLEGFAWESVEEWLEVDGRDALQAPALELSGRLSSQAVEPQFRLVDLAVERLGCVVLDDPCRFLLHTRYLGTEHGMLQQPWRFLFSETAEDLRRIVGVALTD